MFRQFWSTWLILVGLFFSTLSSTPLSRAFFDFERGSSTIYFSMFEDYVYSFYSIQTDGSQQTFLAQSNRGWFRPSPDGRHIVFTQLRSGSIAEGDYDLYVLDIDQRGLTQLTSAGDNYVPVWSPSGDTIAFNSRLDGDGRLVLLASDGSAQRVIALPEKAFSGIITWFPDGNTLLLRLYDEALVCNLYTISSNGTDLKSLTEHFEGHIFGSIALSPDGHTVMFPAALSDDLNSADIYSLDLNTLEIVKLTDIGAFYDYLDFDPTGNRIAYTSNKNGDWEIYLMNRDGTGDVNLTRNHDKQDGVYGLDWSPDGERIVFSSGPYGGDYEIFVIDADGTNLTRLTDNDVHDTDPLW